LEGEASRVKILSTESKFQRRFDGISIDEHSPLETT